MKIERKKHPRMVESSRGLKVRREDEMDMMAEGGLIDTIKNAFTEDEKPKQEDKRPLPKEKAKEMSDVFSSDKYAEGGKVSKTEHEEGGVHKALDSETGISRMGRHVRNVKESGDTDEAKYHNLQAKRSSKRALAELKSMPKPKLAEGGMIDDSLEHEEDQEHYSSVADAIMAKRKKMAQGGVIEANAEEEMANEEYEDLNESVNDDLDQELMDMEQPEDSNLMDIDLDSDEYDHIAEMRRKMRIKSMMSK